ncbi:MAG: hypothetical protein V3W34_15080 [Phycisphaerae bacterium]
MANLLQKRSKAEATHPNLRLEAIRSPGLSSVEHVPVDTRNFVVNAAMVSRVRNPSQSRVGEEDDKIETVSISAFQDVERHNPVCEWKIVSAQGRKSAPTHFNDGDVLGRQSCWDIGVGYVNGMSIFNW